MGRLSTRVQAGFPPAAMALRLRSAMRGNQWATILGYHDVLPSVLQSHHVSETTFARQMERLSRPPFLVEPLSASFDRKELRRTPHRVILTFDDARDNFLDYAFPTLARLRLPSVLYVPSGLVGSTGHLGRS